LRRHTPKGSDLASHDEANLDWVAAELNDRPTRALVFRKPTQDLGELMLR